MAPPTGNTVAFEQAESAFEVPESHGNNNKMTWVNHYVDSASKSLRLTSRKGTYGIE